MPIKYKRVIKRIDLQSNPDCIYVFGDNMRRYGKAGQAAEMRGEPNAVGIATKRYPSMDESSFFADRADEIRCVRADLRKLMQLHLRGKTIVFPAYGIGTGLAQLPSRSPMIHSLIIKWLQTLNSNPPWRLL